MNNITVLYPGGFKPMTGGHLALIKKYAEHPNVKEVQVLVGPGVRNGIDQDLSIEIAQLLAGDIPKVKIIKSPHASPVLASYKTIEEASPGNYCLAASTKGDDYERVLDFVAQHQPGGKYTTPEGVEVVELIMDVSPTLFGRAARERLDEHQNQPISASILRNDILNKDAENFFTGYPKVSIDSVDEIWKKLSKVVVKDGKNAIPSSRSLTRDELIATFAFLSKDLLELFPDSSFIPVGSFDKKPEHYRYGDLDIAFKTSKSLDDIADILEKSGFETVKMAGFNQVTIGYPIYPSPGDIAQVDLMVSDDLDWSEFAYRAPHFSESQFKGAYASFMKMAIISEAFKTNDKINSKGETMEYSLTTLRLNSGLWKVTKTHEGKKGRIKTAKILKEEFLSKDPKKVIKLTFGEMYDLSISTNFEKMWEVVHSPDFIHKDKVPEIISKFNHLLKGSKLPEPDLKIPKKKQVNDHMYHIEQLLFQGEEGLDFIKYAFTQLHHKLNTSPCESSLSTKIDGAPAMMLWSRFPGLPDWGVGIKTVFNKEPVTCHSSEEVDEKFGDRLELADKLKRLLWWSGAINIPAGQIWQGDFLFDKHSKVVMEDKITFRPNTIRYSVDLESELGWQISNSDLGIVWHTRYVGNDIKNVRPIFNINLSDIGHSSILYQDEPYISGKIPNKGITFNGIKDLYKEIDNLRFNNQYKAVLNYKTFGLLFEKFHNNLIRNKEKLNDNFENDFVDYVRTQKSEGIAEKMKTFIKDNWYAIQMLINLTNDIINLKKEFLKELNTYEKYEAYVDLKEGGSKRINQEGFALSSPSGKVVKIVDREEFFYLNSSPEIVKGWEKETVKI